MFEKRTLFDTPKFLLDRDSAKFLVELCREHCRIEVRENSTNLTKKQKNFFIPRKKSRFYSLTTLGCDGPFSPITQRPVNFTAPLNGILNNNSGSSSLSTNWNLIRISLVRRSNTNFLSFTFDRSSRSSQDRKIWAPEPSDFSLKHCKFSLLIFVWRFHCPVLFSSTCWQFLEQACNIFLLKWIQKHEVLVCSNRLFKIDSDFIRFFVFNQHTKKIETSFSSSFHSTSMFFLA